MSAASSSPTELRAAWRALLERCAAGGPGVDRTFDDLVSRHGEPHRRYHTLDHVGEVLATLERIAAEAVDADAVRLAAWFHDAVYDPASPGNEAASAVLAGEQLAALGVPAATVDEVDRLVRLTAGHAPAPADRNGCVLADADLAVLGREPDGYDAYVRAVRTEYGWLDDQAWASGRRAVLEGFLARPRLFATARLHDELEERARGNLGRELAALPEPGVP